MENKVFISRLSQISSLGDRIDLFWQNLLQGKSGASSVPTEFLEKLPVRFAHFIKTDSISLPNLNENKFLTENKIIAKKLIGDLCANWGDAKIDEIRWGNGQSGVKFGDIGSNQPNEVFTNSAFRNALIEIMKELNVEVPSPQNIINISNSCVTGMSAIGQSFQKIKSGRIKRSIVLIQELRCRDWVMWPYYKMGVLSTENGIMRPFSQNRNGFVKGEGGCAFLLESESALNERSSEDPFCEIKGFAQNSDGFRVVEPKSELSSALYCIEAAISIAGIDKAEINYINAYGSATSKNDLMETQLIKKIFGQHSKNICVTASKPQFGHLNTAATAIETLATALMIKNSVVTPTLNLDIPDPQCDLDYVPHHSKNRKIDHALKLGFGFGWSNACLLLAKVK